MTDYKAKVTQYGDYGYGYSDHGEYWEGTLTDGDCITLTWEQQEHFCGLRCDHFIRRTWKPDGKRFYHHRNKDILRAIDAAIAEVKPIVRAAINDNDPEMCVEVDFTGEAPIVRIDNPERLTAPGEKYLEAEAEREAGSESTALGVEEIVEEPH